MKRTALPLVVLTSLALLAACTSSSSSIAESARDMNSNESTKPVPSLSPGMAIAAPGGGSFLSEKLPADVLALPLFDSAGKSFTLAEYSGKYVVITNFLTSCHEICPMTTINMRDIARSVSTAGLSQQVAVLELSVDGELDTAPRLAAYQGLFNDASWTMAGGTTESLAALWKYFGAPAKKVEVGAAAGAKMPKDWQTGAAGIYDMSHSDVVIILGPDSTWRWLDLGSPKTIKGNIPETLKTYLTQDGQQNLAAPEEPTWSVGAVLAALTQLTQTVIK